MRFRSRAGRRWAMQIASAVGLLLLSPIACRPPAGRTLSSPSAVPDPTATVIARTAEPQPADPTPAAPPSPTSARTSTPNVLPTATREQATETPTAPPPTFTPPPPPPLVAGEQLWLQRPVPPSAPSWTDKAYPYGSTRGGTLRPHTGVEFLVPTGTPVLAVAPGTVVAAGNDAQIAYGPQTDFYGNLVIVELDTAGNTPVFALYGHLSQVDVTTGQRVATGDVLGLSGATGVADGPHVHFEVRVGANEYGATRNPLLWLTPLPGTGVIAGRVVNTAGELLYEAPVTLLRVDAPAAYAATTSYAPGDPNGDGVLGENFVLDDVAGGFYEIIVNAGDRRFTTELWVYPGRVNWVELVAAP